MTNEAHTPVVEFAPGIIMPKATRAKAEKLYTTLVAEYPRITFEAVVDGNDVCTGFAATFGKDAEDEHTLYEGAKVPSLAVLLDTCAEEGLDPTLPEEEDEPRVSGSVVPEVYRAKYRTESSTGRSNGDWLAEQLAMDTLNGDQTLMLDDFRAVLLNNGIAMTGKWAMLPETGGRGWQGRYRMNGRQVLEKQVTKAGVYYDTTGTAHTPSEEWLTTMRTKHAKWLAKEAKREAAATAAVKSAVEG
jgi:hypothetical protein